MRFSMKFETTIQEVIPRTPGVLSVRFPRPTGFTYKPGQFFLVTLKFQGKEIVRYFSFSSSPTTEEYIEFTKRLSDSDYSAALKAAKPGDWARIDGPYGEFTFQGEYPRVALLAGGIGITPFMSIIKNATDKHLESQITLFYGCRTPEDITFKAELEELAARNPKVKVYFVVSQAPSDWEGLWGRIDADLIKKYLPDYADWVFFACGPPPMVKAMQAMVQDLGLAKDRFKIEAITGYA